MDAERGDVCATEGDEAGSGSCPETPGRVRGGPILTTWRAPRRAGHVSDPLERSEPPPSNQGRVDRCSATMLWHARPRSAKPDPHINRDPRGAWIPPHSITWQTLGQTFKPYHMSMRGVAALEVCGRRERRSEGADFGAPRSVLDEPGPGSRGTSVVGGQEARCNLWSGREGDSPADTSLIAGVVRESCNTTQTSTSLEPKWGLFS